MSDFGIPLEVLASRWRRRCTFWKLMLGRCRLGWPVCGVVGLFWLRVCCSGMLLWQSIHDLIYGRLIWDIYFVFYWFYTRPLGLVMQFVGNGLILVSNIKYLYFDAVSNHISSRITSHHHFSSPLLITPSHHHFSSPLLTTTSHHHHSYLHLPLAQFPTYTKTALSCEHSKSHLLCAHPLVLQIWSGCRPFLRSEGG